MITIPSAKASPIKTGYLSKQGNSYKSWKRRYFILSTTELAYYKQPSDSTPLGKLDLSFSNVVMGGDRNHFGFKINTPGRTFFFQAESAQEAQEWMQAILTVSSNESLEGYLLKQGNDVLKGWNKRWFFLKKDYLSYYKSKEDSSPLGILHLYDSVVKPSTIVDKKFCFEVSTANRTYYMIAETQEEMDKWILSINNSIRRVAMASPLSPDISKLRRTNVSLLRNKSSPKIKSDLFFVNSRVLKDGYMRKMGHNRIKDWKRRWCVLQSCMFYYFKNKQDDMPAGQIKLGTCRIVVNEKIHQYCIEFVTPARNYFMYAESAEDFQSWMTVLSAASSNVKEQFQSVESMSSVRNEDLSASTMNQSGKICGYLNKKEQKNSIVEQQRYFVIKDDLLFTYKNETDITPKGILGLKDSSVRTTTESEFSFEMALSDRTIYFRAQSHEEMDDWMNAIRWGSDCKKT
eukprot:TRINITY_DN10569_c0_g1_i1.p1 TRINITY_DN10569_c0_g1~~TRINITY_DN10569_c0_g1_i1.p1  ORF type:complete len:460 (+),score=82.51 TRINITY_DN10569_c0_g1_i1:87-1466(+)